MFRVPRMRALWRNMAEEPQIKMDVTEENGVYHVKAEVPGVRKEDIKVSIDGNDVSITAEVKKEKEEKRARRSSAANATTAASLAASRSSTTSIEGKAEAKYQDGVLELTLPMKAVASAKQVAVK